MKTEMMAERFRQAFFTWTSWNQDEFDFWAATAQDEGLLVIDQRTFNHGRFDEYYFFPGHDRVLVVERGHEGGCHSDVVLSMDWVATNSVH